MLSFMPFTPCYAIFYSIYPKLCYLLCHIPRSSAIFFLYVMLQYITLTSSYANSSYAMFSGQSRGRISGYCCTALSQSSIVAQYPKKNMIMSFSSTPEWAPNSHFITTTGSWLDSDVHKYGPLDFTSKDCVIF